MSPGRRAEMGTRSVPEIFEPDAFETAVGKNRIRWRCGELGSLATDSGAEPPPNALMSSPSPTRINRPLLVNGQPHPTPKEGTLLALLESMGLARRGGVAVAVNDLVVPRSDWPGRPVAGGDSVLVIRATQGG